MACLWLIVAEITLSEKAYASWMSSEISFDWKRDLEAKRPTEAEAPFFLKTPEAWEFHGFSPSEFFAEELLHMKREAKNREILALHYEAENECLKFLRIVESVDKNDFRAARNAAALFSAVKFKNSSITDLCGICQNSLDDLRYMAIMSEKTVKTAINRNKECQIPEKFREFYEKAKDNANLPPFQNPLLDGEIISHFSLNINRLLETGIEEILKKASPEKPLIITADGLYKTDGKNVIYSEGAVVPGADPFTFSSLGSLYARDAGSVYYGERKLDGADSDSFYVLAWDYAKDKFRAYFKGVPLCEIKCNFRALRPAYGYATDNETVYYEGRPMEGCDPMSFRSVGEERQKGGVYFALDNFRAYFEGVPIEKADPGSLEHIGGKFFKDKNRVYYCARAVKECKPSSVVFLNPYHIADDEKVFFVSEKVSSPLLLADHKTLRALGVAAADSSRAYYKGEMIEGADGASAVTDDKNNEEYLWDNNSVFYEGEKISSSPKTFRSLGFGYACDHEKGFFKNKIIPLEDVPFFTFLNRLVKDENVSTPDFVEEISERRQETEYPKEKYAKYGENIYYNGEKIEGSDVLSFSPIPLNCGDYRLKTKFPEKKTIFEGNFTDYALDKNNVYYKGKILKNAWPTSFVILNDKGWAEENEDNSDKIYASDGKFVYYKGEYVAAASPEDFKITNIPQVWQSPEFLYFKGEALSYIHKPSFKHVAYNYYKDLKNVYLDIDPIKGLSPENLTVLAPNYLSNGVFFCYVEKISQGSLIANLFKADINSFDIFEINNAFSFDRYGIYFQGLPVEGLDPSSVSCLGDNYMKDKNRVFCGNFILKDADIHSFSLLGEGYATDGKRFYYQYTELDADKALHVLGSGYATDGKEFWLRGQKINNPENHYFLKDVLGENFLKTKREI